MEAGRLQRARADAARVAPADMALVVRAVTAPAVRAVMVPVVREGLAATALAAEEGQGWGRSGCPRMRSRP